MAKMKFERKGAFAAVVEEENAKVEAALKEVEKRVSSNDVLMIDIDMITNPKKHDRVGYSQSTINEMSLSFKEVGQLQPIVVRTLPNGRYERIIGFRRILAAKEAKWTQIKAIVLDDISDDIAALMMLSENMHREDPNIYDQTIKLIEFIAISMGITEDELIKLLYRFRNFDSDRLGNLEEGEKEAREKIEIILERTAKITLRTLSDRLRVLSLDEDIIHAMRERGLSYINAVEINKVKNDEDRRVLLERAIEERPSKNEVIAWVKTLKSDDITESPKDGVVEMAKKVTKMLTAKTIKNFAKADQEKLVEYFAKIDEILSQK
ncbi:ParB/RepB/Spo0J family partition protein [Sulfuricurvum sp.]|uniref:ParB/RepB/Spo0J family partition protein n=1 Tax=Sulfuricurvum sp. TaxID=2025608 RepID=UPI002621E4A3|nr:ParB/RepB/Spo0J family partition protein [Sulfuricurvum sp.]MDD3596147.1 ParB/RepB/Spo0J family partition protein [Sulfuricurvum sp.]